MNKKEVAALADLMNLTGQALKGINLNCRDSTWRVSMERLVDLQAMAAYMEREMRIALKFPGQRDLPLDRIRHEADRLRTKTLASTPTQDADIVQSP